MRKYRLTDGVSCLSTLLACAPLNRQEVKIAHLVDCSLESHRVMNDCQVAYRIFGMLNASKPWRP